MKLFTLLLITLSVFGQSSAPTAITGTLAVSNANGTVTTYTLTVPATSLKALAKTVADRTIQTGVDAKGVPIIAPAYADAGDYLIAGLNKTIADVVDANGAQDPGVAQAIADLNAKLAALNVAKVTASVIVKTVTTK